MVKGRSANLDRVFHALAHPARRAIVRQLGRGAKNVGQLAAPLRMSLPAASKHVRVLEAAGLLQRSIQGRTHVCSLAPEPLAAADRWLRGTSPCGTSDSTSSKRSMPLTARRLDDRYAITPITRTISAESDEVFRVFVEPDLLVRWFAPSDCRCVEAETDPRVGGVHRNVVEAPDGSRHTTVGELLEFVPGRRLVMTWRYQGPRGPEGGESIVTVDMEPEDRGTTTLTLHHDQLASAIDAAGVQEGWRQMLDGYEPALNPERP